MTRQRDFKQLVRERMAKTSERYATARSKILKQLDAPVSPPDVLPGVLGAYGRFGGIQSNTAVVHNVLRHAGILSPLTRAAYTETAINGLCGGPGFLYAVFEYKGMPPMLTLALQSRSMPDVYVAAGLARLGLEMTTSETSSPALARKALDAALAARKAPLCVVDIASLPYLGLPSAYVGGAPHLIAVVDRDDASVWIDDRGMRPRRLTFDELANARARYRHGKHRLITVDAPKREYDAVKAICEAITDTARTYTAPAVPRSFWANCGFAGLDKWRSLLVDRKSKAGWPSLFAEGPRAYAGLQRAYECIESGSAPGAGRALYADFLEIAAVALKQSGVARAATAYRESASCWAEVASLIANCGDRAIRDACELANRRLELGDAAEAGEAEAATDLWQRRHALASECRVSSDTAIALYAKIAGLVGRIAEAERHAVSLMDNCGQRRTGGRSLV